MHKEIQIKNNSILKFPKNIVYKEFNDTILIISVDTANWLVVNDKSILPFFKELIKGENISFVLQLAKKSKKETIFKKLLTQILAREFAGVDAIPQLKNSIPANFMYIYLTNECNLKCSHCYMNSGNQNKDELTTEKWIEVINQFQKNGGLSLTITGGEPVMQSGFENILKHSSNLKIQNTVLTNGTLWTNQLIDKLSPYINEVQISIDGVDEISNSIIRGKGYFDKAVNTTIRFANNGIRTSVATTFTFENLKFAQRYNNFVEKINKETNNKVFFKLSKKILKGRNVNYSNKENNKFYDEVKKIENLSYNNSDLKNFIIEHEPNTGMINCGFGGISLDASGNVFFCNRISEIHDYGNILQKPLKDFIKIGHEINKLTSVDNVTPCRECELKYICGGGCRIDDYNFKGIISKHITDYKQISCSIQFKEKLYKKMIDSNILFYKF